MKSVLPVLAAVAMSACWLQDCAATTDVTREEMAAHAERVAKWTALDGEWEGGLTFASVADGVANEPLYLRIGFSDRSVSVSTRKKESASWTVSGTYTLTSVNKERAVTLNEGLLLRETAGFNIQNGRTLADLNNSLTVIAQVILF